MFLSLLPDPASTEAVGMMQAALDPAVGATVVVAPVRGLMFFSARGAVARELDGWWERHVPEEARPVILVMDEPGLEAHLGGLDSDVVVGVASDAERARYARHQHSHLVVTGDPVALAEHAMAAFPCFSRAPEEPIASPAASAAGMTQAAGCVIDSAIRSSSSKP